MLLEVALMNIRCSFRIWPLLCILYTPHSLKPLPLIHVVPSLVSSEHTMAILFDKVPREIRDMIYHLLLVKGYPGVELRAIERNRRYSFPDIDLHPAIMRTCKQAYTEGLSILYEQNNFIYESYTPENAVTMATEDLLKDKTRNIKQVRELKSLYSGRLQNLTVSSSSRSILMPTWNQILKYL